MWRHQHCGYTHNIKYENVELFMLTKQLFLFPGNVKFLTGKNTKPNVPQWRSKLEESII